MSDSGWGVGDRAGSPAFDTVAVDGTRVLELIHGQYPHSRQDNAVYARDDQGRVEAWSGHRAPVTIAVSEYNYFKTSGMTGDEWRRGCKTQVSVSGRHVYTLGAGRDWAHALQYLPHVINQVLEHAVRFWDDADLARLPGRRVWYRDQAALVERWHVENGVFLVPDGQWFFRRPGWSRGDDDVETWESEYGRGLYVDVLSSDIYWQRDAG